MDEPRGRFLTHFQQDCLVAAALVALSAVDMTFLEDGGYLSSPVVNVLFTLAWAVPLAWRRRAPELSFVALNVAVVILGYALFAPETPPVEPFLGALVVYYTIGCYAPHSGNLLRDRATYVFLAGLIPFLVLQGIVGGGSGNVITVAIFLTITWGFGQANYWRMHSLKELGEYARMLQEREEEQMQRAASEERARIARELHDVIAHHVSAIVVQASTERRLNGDAQGSTVEVLEAIEHSGRQATVELRRVLGVLRNHDESPLAQPQPALGNVRELVSAMTDAGLEIALFVDGDLDAIPDGIGLSGYRIVQEALTNVVKHAGAEKADVSIVWEEPRLDLTIKDDGRRREDLIDFGDGGNGMIGMRERVAMFNGSFDAGPTTEGGFEVRATLSSEL